MDGQPAVLPDSPSNRELAANVHPPDWVNPAPARRYNLVVVGAGTAGLVCASGAVQLGAKVALVEGIFWAATASTWGACPPRGCSGPPVPCTTAARPPGWG